MHPFVPEQLVVAVLASRPGLLAGARTALEERFGPVDFASDPVPWSFSAYYDREMGPGIVRLFWSFERLVDPAGAGVDQAGDQWRSRMRSARAATGR